MKSVPIDIGLNIMFWGVFHEFKNMVICDSVTCEYVTEKYHFFFTFENVQIGSLP